MTGMPVIWKNRRIGRLLKGELSDDLTRLNGIWVGAGLKGTHFIPSESLQLLGDAAILADGCGIRRRMHTCPLFRRVVSTDGRRAGAVTGAAIDELSFAVTALQLTRGLWDDILSPHPWVTRYTANRETGEVVIDLAEVTKEGWIDEGHGKGSDHRYADRLHGGDGVRRDELADRAQMEPAGAYDRKLDIRQGGSNRKQAVRRLLPILLASVVGLWLLRRPTAQAAGLALGGAAFAFALCPLAALLERRFSRPAAALAAVGLACATAALLVFTILPMTLRELSQLSETLPHSAEQLSRWTGQWIEMLQRRLPGLKLPEPNLNGLTALLPDIATGTMSFVSNCAGFISRLSMAVMLGFFFLCDRERLLLRLELLIPSSRRADGVRATRALTRELRLYLMGQLTIAGAVGVLAAAGLWLIGLRGAPVLGGMVGLLNMIPYFGPFIGGVPAVLTALGDGWPKAALCVGVLALVQQIDAAILSPRVMGSLTGFSPASVLLAIFAGASLGGIVGMLTALPLLMAVRTFFRVFVFNRENI